MAKPFPKTAETLVQNLSMLMAETGTTRSDLSRKSKVSPRMVAYILTRERVPSIEVADQLAQAFGLTGWQLLIPSLRADLARSGNLSRLVERYSSASERARDYIDMVAERESKHSNNS